jgi:hypothetical protein
MPRFFPPAPQHTHRLSCWWFCLILLNRWRQPAIPYPVTAGMGRGGALGGGSTAVRSHWRAPLETRRDKTRSCVACLFVCPSARPPVCNAAACCLHSGLDAAGRVVKLFCVLSSSSLLLLLLLLRLHVSISSFLSLSSLMFPIKLFF